MVDTNKNQNEETISLLQENQSTDATEEKKIGFNSFSWGTKEEKNEPIFLWESGIQKSETIVEDDTLAYRKLFFSGFFMLLISIVGIIWVNLYTKYLKIAAQPIVEPQYESYINKYKNSQNTINDYIKFSSYNQYVSLDFLWENADKNIKNVINTNKLSYIQKKDIIQSAITKMSEDIVSKYNKIESIKKDVTKYGFFPLELYSLLEGEEYITSLKKSLLSLEMIKFWSALKVFSYLPSFITELSESLGITEKEIKDKINKLSDRWEKDIAIYLNNCYLNPYEVDYNCGLINDFDRYYNLVSKEKSPIDIPFFKKLMFYIDAKLEQSNIPNFSITFNQFDPKSKKISFNITINTSNYDEESMTINEWIVNPHIFIFTNLLNLLKQSIFVVSDSINIKQLAINEQEVTEGWRIVKYHSSSTSFSLPIQKAVEREITDFLDDSKFILSE